MPTPQVLIIDDDAAMRRFLCEYLERRNCSGVALPSAEAALEHFRARRPDAILLDVVLPGGMDGLDALAAFRRIDRDVPVIVISGHGRTATVVQAMKLGATDFITKPFTETDLEQPLTQALRQRQLSQERAMLRQALQAESRDMMLLGTTVRMQEVRDLIDRVAETDVTVLVRGESGTGKELVARALHARSTRQDKPFVKVNCAALPTELLESELFGFEKGAFTGAIHQKPGKFEFANQGTMFLDEISEMSPALQAKLLQVLQDGEFSRLGGKSDLKVDVRVIAATNRDLETAVANGSFREDLFFRLNVVSIRLPPLRERREDIPALVAHFLKKHSVHYNKALLELSPGTIQMLTGHDWPGNIRELENLIKRAVVLGSEEAIQKELQQAPTVTRLRGFAAAAPNGAGVAAAPAAPAAASPVAPATNDPPAASPALPANGKYSLKDISRQAAREAERELILRMLQHTRWNRRETAAILGISYKALLYKIKEAGLDRAS
ncbi:MAG TPA: sigma-54 dependent transcriptional regulator [Vicinamibacterales bacterium]|nr:sigma-54 dependent transcriptional regulator [Vicinamibacterales bacterium]